MKILILGNGFDLAGNLSTSYDDFFGYRKKNIEECINVIDTYMNSELIFENNITYEQNFHSSQSQLQASLLDNKVTCLLDHIDKMIECLKNVGTSYNFWDIYFYYMEKKFEENMQWSSIELQIEKLIGCNMISRYDCKETFLWNILFFDEKNHIRDRSRGTGDNVLRWFSNNQIYSIFIRSYLTKKYGSLNEVNIFRILLKELKLFEEEFQKYIHLIMNLVNKDNTRKRLYRDNLLKIFDVNEGENNFVLNFNYTSPISKLIKKDMSSKSKNHIEITRRKVDYPISSNNVHGLYDKIAIFGVDQRNIDAALPQYIFTKTYRKISEQSSLSNTSLPEKCKDLTIIFYGHSLSQADYSYFQSIFDIYDIYNDNVTLIFYYSLYGNNENMSEDIGHSMYESVTRLLQEYGNTMNNKDHGKNLVHKLVLENRLKIETITLSKVFDRGECSDLLKMEVIYDK